MAFIYRIGSLYIGIRNSEPCPNDPTKCLFEITLCDDTQAFESFCTGDAYYCNPSTPNHPGELICGVGDIKPLRKDTIINGRLTYVYYFSGYIDEEMENYILHGDNRIKKIKNAIQDDNSLETFCISCKDDYLEVIRYSLLGQELEKNLVQNNFKDLNNSVYTSSHEVNGVQFISVYCKSTKKSIIIKQIH